MADELIVQVRQEEGYTVVAPAGEIDIATAPALRECLTGLLTARRRVIVDLDRVSFLDAAGLGVLVGAANRANAHRTSLRLACAQPQVRRLFTLTRLDGRLPLARTLGEAAAALHPGPDMPAGGQPPAAARAEPPRRPDPLTAARRPPSRHGGERHASPA